MLRKFKDGQKIIVDTWTTSRRSTSPAAQPGTSGTVTKTPSYWYAMMTTSKQGGCRCTDDFFEHSDSCATRYRGFSCEHTHHCFGSHGRTDTQGHRNLADHDPCVPVSSFNHDTTSTSTVVLGASIPEAFHRVPCLSIIASVNNNFSLSLCSQVGPVISFLIVFPENVLHVNVNLRDGVCDLPVPP